MSEKLTARVLYAFNPGQGNRSNGGYHAVLDQPLHAGRLHRESGDALCKPRRKFWGLSKGNGAAEVSCTRCLDLMACHDITISADPAVLANP